MAEISEDQGPISDLPIPALECLDATWMTRLVQALGFDDEVRELSLKPIGTGQMADSYRISLRYANGNRGAPGSFVGKFPSANASSRESAKTWGAYLREVRFYQCFASSAGLRTPQCYYASIDAETHDFALLLEDLAPAQQGDQLEGLPPAHVELALDEAAKLHASHWDDAGIDDISWVDGSRSAPEMFSAKLVADLWALFRSQYVDLVDQDCIRVGDALAENFDNYRHGYKGPRCLVHTDFRSDNLLFGSPAGGYPVAVVDWQSLGFRCCMNDVSYFISGAMPAAQRRVSERGLLQRYHQRLLELGVSNYSFDQAWSDYARYSFALFLVSVVAAVSVKRTERGDRMFMAMVRNSVAQAIDLNAMALIR